MRRSFCEDVNADEERQEQADKSEETMWSVI